MREVKIFYKIEMKKTLQSYVIYITDICAMFRKEDKFEVLVTPNMILGTYDNVSELCVWFTQYNSSCKQVAWDSFRQKL